jgi:hypothetical protein
MTITMKYFAYALGVKVAITGAVLYLLWRRRQRELEELAANDIYALTYLK